jgi:hydrogenase small subunit
MDTPPGGGVSAGIATVYGPTMRRLRTITNRTVNKETSWRHNRDELTTGYQPKALQRR